MGQEVSRPLPGGWEGIAARPPMKLSTGGPYGCRNAFNSGLFRGRGRVVHQFEIHRP